MRPELEERLRERLRGLAAERDRQRTQPPPSSVPPELATCQDFCPEYERLERLLHGDLTRPFESDDNLQNLPIVKKYHRPAAGNETPLPEDIRPPTVILACLQHLFRNVLARFPDCPLVDKQKFLRDRLRSLRQDLSMQACQSPVAVFVNECIGRFHIYVGWSLRNAPKADFDAFQNLEQLRKVLQSLHELHGTQRSGCRGEFTAYRVLAHLDDPQEAFALDAYHLDRSSDTAHLVTSVQDDQIHGVSRTSPVQGDDTEAVEQAALDVAAAFHSGNIVRLRRVGGRQSYLFQCLLESQWREGVRARMERVGRLALGDDSAQHLPEDWDLCFADLQPIADLADLAALLLGEADARQFQERAHFKAICRELSRHILDDTLHRQIPTLLHGLLADCLKMAQQRRTEQHRQYADSKRRLVQEVASHFFLEHIGDIVGQLSWDIVHGAVGDYQTEQRLHFVGRIYAALVHACVPFFVQRILGETLADRGFRHRRLSHFLRIWRRQRRPPRIAQLQQSPMYMSSAIPAAAQMSPPRSDIAMDDVTIIRQQIADLQTQLEREQTYKDAIQEQLTRLGYD